MQPSCVSSPCPGMGAPLAIAPVPKEVIQGAVNRGAGVIAQLINQYTSSVQQGVQAGVQTTASLLGKFDSAVSAGQAAGQSTIDGLAANFRMSATSQAVPQGGTPGGGGTGKEGYKPGDCPYNVWQRDQPPYETEILPAGMTPVEAAHPFCFYGCWDNVYDAVAAANGASGNAPPNWCHPLGGPPVGQDWCAFCDANGVAGGYLCGGSPPPDGVKLPGTYATQADAEAYAKQYCKGSGGTGFYAGCDAKKNPIVWSISDPIPIGAINISGPYADAAGATAVAVNQCKGSGSTGNGTGTNGKCPPTQVTCPAPIVNVSCTSGGPTSGGPPGKVELPDCIHIDLCDWEKFKTAMVDILCEWYDRCVCKLENQAAYFTADCDDKYRTQMDEWMGGVGSIITKANNMDQVVQRGKQAVSVPGASGAPAGFP